MPTGSSLPTKTIDIPEEKQPIVNKTVQTDTTEGDPMKHTSRTLFPLLLLLLTVLLLAACGEGETEMTSPPGGTAAPGATTAPTVHTLPTALTSAVTAPVTTAPVTTAPATRRPATEAPTTMRMRLRRLDFWTFCCF